MVTCPKCAYVRKADDDAPDWQCPGCGIVYAKYGTAPHGHAHNFEPHEPSGAGGYSHGVPLSTLSAGGANTVREEEIISTFQQNSKEMKPQWNRNWIFFGVPGFLLIAFGDETKTYPLLAAGLVLFAIAFVRSFRLYFRYMRCPACNALQQLALSYPYKICGSCGARLSHGMKDSL